MGKSKRGLKIKEISNWRGSCPSCKRTGVKLLWDKTGANDNQIKVCKHCGN